MKPSLDAVRAEADEEVVASHLYYRGAVPLPNGSALEFFVTFNVETTPATATIDIPAQGASAIPLADVAFAPDGDFAFTLAQAKASWRGSFQANPATCEFSQGGYETSCELALSDARAEAPKRPQTPRPPFPYRVIDVSYENAAAKVKLAGTLTIPQSGGPHPAALLITGSGSQDRDETILGHKPFLVLADHLTRQGIAVLRVDDRGVGGSTAGSADATSADFAGDVRAGVEFLRSRNDIDSSRIGLIGHSEGGLIAPMVAAKDPTVAFVVLLAGPGVPGGDIIVRQAMLGAKANGQPYRQVEADQRAIIEAVKSSPDGPTLRKKAMDILVSIAKRDGKAVPGEQTLEATLRVMGSPWYRFFVSHDPRADLAALRCPVLALNGELDQQVDAEQNLPAIAKAAKHAEVHRLPRLNHLFQTAKTGAVAEYQTLEETFAPAALEKVSSWVLQAVKE